MYRNNARKRPPGRRCDCARVKRHPGAFTTWLGHFLGKDSPPLGDTKRKKKKTHASHTQQQHCSSNRCSSSRRPAPIKAQTTTQTLGEAHAVLVKRRTRGRARRRQVPRLRPHLLRSRSYSADHSLAFALRALNWSVGWGRGAALLLDGDEAQGDRYSCLGCPDGDVVGNRGAAAGWDRGCVRSESGNGFKPKIRFVEIMEVGACFPDTCRGRKATVHRHALCPR